MKNKDIKWIYKGDTKSRYLTSFWGRDDKLFGHPARLDNVLSGLPFLFSAKFQFSYLPYDYFNFIPNQA